MNNVHKNTYSTTHQIVSITDHYRVYDNTFPLTRARKKSTNKI